MTEPTIYLAAEAVVDRATRTFSGVAVTYGEMTQDGRQINFAKGAFGDLESQSLTAVLLQHPFSRNEPAVHVGRVTSWLDTDEALTFEARLDESEDGEATYQALLSGELDSVSVGVYASHADEADGVTTFTSASLLELSVITDGKPALAGSKILSVFAETAPDEATASTTPTAKETPLMDTNLDAQVADLAGSVEDLGRQFATFADAAPAAPAESRFETFGSIVKAIASGDKDAEAEYMAYTGGTTADTVIRPGWARDTRKFVEARRTIFDSFRKEPLPAEGMTISYFVDGVDTTQVEKQAAEGADLPYGKITLAQASTAIETFGGWVEWSAQQIERSPISVIDEGYRSLAKRYAQVTEASVRTKFLNAASQSVTAFDATNYGKVVDAVADGAVMLDDAGYNLEFIVISPATFKKLAKLQVGTNGAYILDRADGSLNIPGISGDLFNVPLRVLPSAVGDLFVMANKDALTTWEDGGAPHRLQDSNVVNLTSQFSLYGWLASAVTAPKALVKATA